MRCPVREVVYKNLTSITSRKKDIFLKEVYEQNGVMAKTERRCFYYIKEIKHLETEDDLKFWIESKNDALGSTKRHFHIFKQHDDIMGQDKIICKVAGTFYAVAEKTVYTIAFLHSFKVSFARAHIA
jgi:hypothetical protein